MKHDELVNLINDMTLEEKVGQMTQMAGYLYEKHASDVTGPLDKLNAPEHLELTNGSIVGSYNASTIKKIQDNYLEKSRLKIPLLFTADVIHGHRTIFPINLAIGSSWNIELAEKSAEIAAKEAAVSGIHLTFSPMVDLTRDPRWGRVMESTGEDSFLNAEFARAFVEGYQGNDLKNDTDRVAACVKHFIGYGLSEGGRDYNTVDLSRRELLENEISGFEAAIAAGVQMVMTSFNPIDGIPATGNKELINGVLREKLGFDGVVISDWNSLGELIPYGVAENEFEAAKMAIDATLDIEMMTFCYARSFEKLLDEEKISMDMIDASVLRILELKNNLGLFENPYRGLDEEKEEEIHLSKEHRVVAREVAEESIVLLKNDKNILPLKKGNKVALIGPFINDSNVLGFWHAQGKEEEASQLLDAMKNHVHEENLIVSKGSELFETDEKLLEEAVDAASQSDVIVLALGEHFMMSGEASSRTDITLPAAQIQLFHELKKTGKPIITVLFNGRPLDLTNIISGSDAILEAWYLGTESGNAIANILYGEVNPSGKLTMSFPYNVGQIPVYYNHYSLGRPLKEEGDVKWVSRYLDAPNDPRYPFGYGLSYTTFEYGEITLSSKEFSKEKSLEVSVNVTNIGDVTGKEIVQLYIQDLVGKVIRPVKELKGFKKIELHPAETKKVTFTVKEEMVRYIHHNLEKRSDVGDFNLFIGGSSTDVEAVSVRLIE